MCTVAVAQAIYENSYAAASGQLEPTDRAAASRMNVRTEGVN
ncbi:hypothetical protein [Nocardia higoensis]|nr:hypothetical protein [Nocardia higoensis]